MENIIMTNLPIILSLLSLFAVVAGIGGIGLALKTGKISGELLSSGSVMLEGIKSATDALYTATGNPAVAMTSFIIEVVGKAARAAEQLYAVGQIKKDERNAKAKEIAEDLLRMAGIEVTDDRKAAIAVLLEAECDAMGHSIKARMTLEEAVDRVVDELTEKVGVQDGVEVPDNAETDDVKVYVRANEAREDEQP